MIINVFKALNTFQSLSEIQNPFRHLQAFLYIYIMFSSAKFLNL